MNEIKEFGNKIRSRRIELDMTQDELARLSGYTSRSSINKIEMGLVDLPQSKILAISNALSISPIFLLGWDIPTSPSTPPPQQEQVNLTDDKKRLLNAYEALTPPLQDYLIETAENLASKQNTRKKFY